MTTSTVCLSELTDELTDDAVCEFTGCVPLPAEWIVSNDCPGCGYVSRCLACDECKTIWTALIQEQGFRVRCRKCSHVFVFSGTWRKV